MLINIAIAYILDIFHFIQLKLIWIVRYTLTYLSYLVFIKLLVFRFLDESVSNYLLQVYWDLCSKF